MNMTAPDAISPEELEFLAESAEAGITQLDPAELIVLAKGHIKALEKITRELDSCQTSTISPGRWEFLLTARKSIKIAIRNLKRCIAI